MLLNGHFFFPTNRHLNGPERCSPDLGLLQQVPQCLSIYGLEREKGMMWQLYGNIGLICIVKQITRCSVVHIQ